MAVNKTSRTIAGGIHHLFQIQLDDVRRKLGIGSTWNILRLGCRFSYATDPGASQVIAQEMAFGLQKSAGTSYGAVTPSSNHQIVIGTKPWIRSSGPPVTFSSISTGDTVIKAVHGSTIDSTGSSAASTNAVVSADLNYLTGLVLQVERGVTDWLATAIIPTSVAPTHCSSEQLRAAVTAATMTEALAALPSGGYTKITKTLAGQTARVTSYGEFDEIVFSSKVAGSGLIVGDFMVYRFS